MTLSKDGYAPLARKITPTKDGDQIQFTLIPLSR
jgi:hypothetical protein